ncbi:MAG: hypothetical protein ACTTKH_03230 [Treponema sp.]
MEVYVEEAVTENECLQKIYKKYGTDVNIIRKHIKVVPRLFGLFERELCEVSFSLPIPNSIGSYDIQNKNYEKNAALIDAHAKRIREQEEKKADVGVPSFTSLNEKKEVSIQNESYEKLKKIVEELAVKITAGVPNVKEHENLEKIKITLKDNDFSDEYISSLVEAIKKEVTVEELENYSVLSKKVLDYIATSVEVKQFEPIPEKKSNCFCGAYWSWEIGSFAFCACSICKKNKAYDSRNYYGWV